MWFSLALLVIIVLAGTYYLTIQGFTTAFITCVLTIVCLAVAFGTYEYVAQKVFIGLLPDYAYAWALMGMFIVPLIILRILMDIWVPRAHLLPQLLDKGAAAAAGLISTFMIAGVLAIAIEMSPWGPSVLGFQRFNPEKPDEQSELLFKPDRAAAGFASALSGGPFSGTVRFASIHPDLITEIGWVQSAPAGISRVVPPDSVSFVDAGHVNFIYEREIKSQGPATLVPLSEFSGAANMTLPRVALQLRSEAANKDGKHLFTLRQVRLVGDLVTDDTRLPAMYHAIAVADKDVPTKFVRSIKTEGRSSTTTNVEEMVLTAAPNGQIDVAFQVPQNFDPRFVAYKQGPRIPIRKQQFKSAVVSPPEQTTAAPQPTPPPVVTPGGRVAGVKFVSSHFGGDLPLKLTNYSGDADMQGDELVQGHVLALVADQEGGSQQPVSALKVPQGRALLQLNVENLQAGSTLGRALSYSVHTIENYTVTDEHGRQYTPVGKYAAAKVGGEMYFELQYYPEYAESGARAIRPFDKIKNQNLRDDYKLVYLYLLPPGTKVTEFSTGRATTDLRNQNLVAP